MNTISYWSDSISLPRFRKLREDCEVDVVVIGAGITGITAAYLFRKAGQTVALIERGPCGGFDTVNTTAHVTCVTDTTLTDLCARLGPDRAWGCWEAGRAALEQIEAIVQAEDIQCDFQRVPGYRHAPPKSCPPGLATALDAEARLAVELGFAAEFVSEVPWMGGPGVRFDGQAKFHPLKYLAALLRIIPGEGSQVFDKTEVTRIADDPLRVCCGEVAVRCRYVVIATGTPLPGMTGSVSAGLLQAKLFHYTSYAISARIPTGLAPEACFWDTESPYHYLRIDHRYGHDVAIFGGEDHKTGQIPHPLNAYAALQARFKELLPQAKVTHHWSGQVIETPDGLPFLGETAERQFVATGFGGNGITFGTFGAMMAVDAFLGRKNPWTGIFDVHRPLYAEGTAQCVQENKDYPYHMLRDWWGDADGKSPEVVRRNQGRILDLDGRKVAAYRDVHGKVVLLSAVCPHLKCIVTWNDAESTWDCPCHGSRFAATGEALSGPAAQGLSKLKS
ncbi:MAG TPA: FAD-dependent oxidoreductase [Candidatus Limnocylindria bacterium]|jgi:glycine/D-amino acid oxidase-like deaminating enzyme/nitrite reductase/ring-hydroxylating ferredoxin subunit|nr:FAD-dependent oxidoreductase [Candidatus Limnocylindria bacterium]